MSDIFQIIRTNNVKEYYSAIDNIDINTLNDYKQNSLQESIAYDNDEISYDLIKREINLNHKDEDGKTSLHYCAAHNNYDIAKIILEKGCDINICDNHGNNPLWVAVFNARGVYNMVELFVVFKANINNKNNADKSSLDFAKQIEDEELIEILIQTPTGARLQRLPTYLIKIVVAFVTRQTKSHWRSFIRNSGARLHRVPTYIKR